MQSKIPSNKNSPGFPRTSHTSPVFSSFIYLKIAEKFRQRSTTFALALIRLQFLSEVSDTQGFWCCFYPFFGD
ncbi:hypothetical protein AAZX31_18G070900 [Glycine max]